MAGRIQFLPVHGSRRAAKMKTPRFFGIHANPGQQFNWMLAILPFILIIAAYITASQIRYAENPRDRIMPTISKMVDSTIIYAFEPDRRGNYRLPKDAVSSLTRIVIGVGFAAFVGLMIGMNMALFPGMSALFSSMVTFLSIIPPLALMPMFLITLGTGEVAKISLIFIGVVFMITRDIYRESNAIPKEQITKALSLGATQLEVVYKIVLPQIMPALISTVRLSLGAAWLFLIAGEAIASTDGLGYRIFVVKRYMAMDVIIPYVMVITLLGYLMDFGLRKLISWRFPWYVAIKEGK